VVLFKRVSFASLLIAPVLALAVPAEAASPASLPNVAISGKPAVYKPSSLSGVVPHWNGTETCTTNLESFSLTNKTSVSQEIIEKEPSGNKVLGSLPAGKTGGICINTNQKGKTLNFTLGSNKKANLAVHVS
jgi:hypothetical protein